MTNILEQHPRLVAELARVVKDWGSLPDGGEMWVLEVLDGFDERGEYEISGRETVSGNPIVLPDTLVDVFLSKAEVADLLGKTSLGHYRLPAPDAVTGKVRGWRVSTILAWNAARPGRGRWGAR